MITTSLFGPSMILSQRSIIDLSREISWSEHRAKPYVIRDPNNPDEILHLTVGEYNKLSRVMLSNELTLEVIATPRDTPSSILKKFPTDEKSSAKSPFSTDNKPSEGNPLFFEAGWFASNKLFNLTSGWHIRDSMIAFKRNFKHFIPHYYSNIISWMGLRRPARSFYQNFILLSKAFDHNRNYRGLQDTINKMKISSIVVLQYIAGNRLSSTENLGQRIKLIHGLPAILPLQLRHIVRTGSTSQIRVLLTVLSSFKGFSGTYSKPSFETITAPAFQRPLVKESEPFFPKGFPFNMKGLPFRGDFLEDWSEVDLTRRRFWDFINPTNIRCKFDVDFEQPPLTTTASPSNPVSFVGSQFDAFAHISLGNYSSLMRFIKAIQNVHLYRDDIKSKVVDPYDLLLKMMHRISESTRKKYPGLDAKSIPLGKLALKYEPAGKIRVFAMVDYWSQWVLKSIHLSMFNVLKQIPSDATFDQLGKVKELSERGFSYFASFDLKSATDLIPQQLYIKVLEPFITLERGDNLVTHWMNVLRDRKYFYENKSYSYSRGQPMGALSSWAALALVHHYLVYLSAYRVKISSFKDYLILGDDIVIANKKVAEEYLRVCKDYGITISLPKSFISSEGFFQFAAQDILKGVNLSPISLREVISISRNERYLPIYKGISVLNQKVEFVNRLQWKGFIESGKPLSAVRALVNARDWKIISRSLTRGIFPTRLEIALLSILRSTIMINPNMVSVVSLIAVLYRDLSMLTNKTRVYSNETIRSVINDLLDLYIIEFEKAKLEAFKRIGKLGEVPTVDHPLGEISRRAFSNKQGQIMSDLMKVLKDYNTLLEQIGGSLEQNRLAYLIDSTYVPFTDDLTISHFIELNRLIRLLEGLQSTSSIF